MAVKLWDVGTSNAFQTTLNGNITDSDSSITLTTATGLVAPGVLVIDRTNGVTSTPTQREYITFTGISTNTLTGVTRGVAGSTAQAHNSGAIVEEIMSVTHWGDLKDFLEVSHDASGNIVTSTATISILRNWTHFNVSGASITGVYPSGASGGYLISQGNGIAPVYTASPVSNLTNANMANRTRNIFIPAGNWAVELGSPTRTTDGTDLTVAWLLDAASTESIISDHILVPEDIVGANTITVKAYFAMVSATSGNVRIQLDYRNIADGGTITNATNITTDTISVPGTADTLKIYTFSAATGNIAAGDLLKFRFIRIGGDAADTATGDMQFLGLELEYTADM